jgi:DNA polymerase-4
MEECWRGEGIFQVQVTALDPRPARRQGELFAAVSPKRDDLNRAMDAINRRFGEFALAPGWLLNRSTMPNVIAPAWKPFGHRQTI